MCQRRPRNIPTKRQQVHFSVYKCYQVMPYYARLNRTLPLNS